MTIQCHQLNLHLTYQTNFFLNKIQKIKKHCQEPDTHKSYHRKCSKYTSFAPLEKDELLNIIKRMNPTTCIMDPCNTEFVVKFKNTILDSITTIVNQSLTTGIFLKDWKIASVRPLIKGLNLDTELRNYRLISNLSFLYKIIEKTAQTQLQKHFDNQSITKLTINYQNTKVLTDKVIQRKQYY